MATKSQSEPAVSYTVNRLNQVVKQCACGATFFQGPFQRGEIVNGVFEMREQVYQCLNCHKVQTVEQMLDREIQSAI